MYTKSATSLTPALIIYLIDISDSMNDPSGVSTAQAKIEVVNMALKFAVRNMLRQCMRDLTVLPRYKLAIFAYNTQVYNLLGGIKTISEVAKQIGTPELIASGSTNTEKGFAEVARLLSAHLAEYQHCPAPLICHLTDGLITSDPQPLIKIVQDIKAMHVEDGNVLVENVYVADKMLHRRVQDWHSWHGVLKVNQLTNEYAKLLFNISSPLPESYRQNINDSGYSLQEGAALFFPGVHSELVRLAFVASKATQLK